MANLLRGSVPRWRIFSVALCLCGVLTTDARGQTPHERPALGSIITVPTLGELPTNDNALSLLDAAQADLIADRIDTGGLSVSDPARMGAHGSTWTQTRFRVGVADVTDPEGTGAPLILPSVVLWERIDIATGLIPPTVNAPGLAITFEPRRPATTWTGSFGGSLARPPMLAREGFVTNPPAIARLHEWNHGDVVVGGPIVSAKAGLVLAGDWTRASRFERDDPTLLESTNGSGFAHLELTPAPSDSVRLLGWIQRSRAPFANRNAFGEPAAADRRTAVHTQGLWERRLPSDLYWTLFGSYTRRSDEPDVGAAPAIVIERLRDGPVPSLLNPRIGTTFTWSAGARAALPEFGISASQHDIRLAVEVSGGAARTHAGFTGSIGELVDGLPARVWSYLDSGREAYWHKTTAAVDASDRIVLMPGLLFDAAIRFETTGGSAADGSNAIRWNNWFPRGSLRWEIADRMGLAAFIGYGRYGYDLPLRYFAYGDADAQVGSVYRWRTTLGNHAPLASETGELIARVGPGTGGNPQFSAIDPKLRRPFMDEIALGFESRPSPSTVMRLAAIARREKQLVALLNPGVPLASYTIVRVPDPGLDLMSPADDQLLGAYNRSKASFGADRYLLTNPSDDQATYVGVDATAQTTVSRFVLIAGGTAGRSEGWSANRGFQAIENDEALIGELFTNPNATTYAKGRLFTERGYTLKTAGVYRFPGDVQFGVIGRYQDGQHFARLVIFPNLNQGPEAVRAFANGRTRFTYSMTVDARLQKGFTIGSTRIAAMIDGYNLLNTAKEVEEFPVTGPQSRLTAAVQPPRALHIGFRVTF